MTVLENIFLALHLLGFGALFGGILIQAKDPVKKVNFLMRDGAGTVVVAGILLYVLDKIDKGQHHATAWDAKMGVMMLIGIVIVALVMANVRKASISKNFWMILLGLTIINVGVATIWSAS